MHFDILMRGGTILDGVRSSAFGGDIGIRSGRIVAIGDLGRASAEQALDVSELVIVPGLIDSHTHSDLAPFLDKSHADIVMANIRQGVTTEICGNCGFSPFPTLPQGSRDVERYTKVLFGPIGRSYQSLGEFQQALGQVPLIANVAPLVGHGTLRAAVMGFSNRPPSGAELEAMKRLFGQALEEGAFGLSSGLIYAPGMYASTEELAELTSVADKFRRPYVSHIRNETDDVLAAVKEAIKIAKRSSAGLHISHHKAGGRSNWGRTAATIEVLNQARKQGLNVTLDVYPYTAGSTELVAILPPWVQEGGIDLMLNRLANGAYRLRISRELAEGIPGWQNLVEAAGWEGIAVASARTHPWCEGRSISALAADRGQDPVDFICDLLLEEEGAVTVVLHMMHETDVRNVLAWPFGMIGSDGILLPGRPHPRIAGAFARVLGKYARDEQIVSVPDAIRKMTSFPAERFGISDRGSIAINKAADLAVMDLRIVQDQSTYADPLRRPLGVVHVMVNGSLVIKAGEDTGVRSGKLLRPAVH